MQGGLLRQLQAMGVDLNCDEHKRKLPSDLESMYRKRASVRLRQLMDRAYIAGPPGNRPDTVVLRRIPLEALGWTSTGSLDTDD